MTSGGHEHLRNWRVSAIPVTRCRAVLRGRESSRALSLSLSLRLGIALWTACFPKECFVSGPATSEGKKERRAAAMATTKVQRIMTQPIVRLLLSLLFLEHRFLLLGFSV